MWNRIKNTLLAWYIYLRKQWIYKLICAIMLRIQNPRWRFIHYIQWVGIEIWALQNPLPVPKSQATVHYVDYKTTEELRTSYPELKNLYLVPVTFLGNAENLETIKDQSQDFVILNHVFEHLKNPLQALSEFYRVLVPWWIVYLAIPEKTRTFDKKRERTSIAHMVADYKDPSDERDRQHFTEYASNFFTNQEDISREAERLYSIQYSIHYHVFIQEDVEHLIQRWNEQSVFNFSIIDQKSVLSNPADHEFILILKKR